MVREVRMPYTEGSRSLESHCPFGSVTSDVRHTPDRLDARGGGVRHIVEFSCGTVPGTGGA